MTAMIGETDTQTPGQPSTEPQPEPHSALRESDQPASRWGGKRIYRSRNERMIAGVSGGLGEYLDVDPTIVRLGFVITSFFGGAGIVAYAVAWLIVPEA